jgi:hypothetical protein
MPGSRRAALSLLASLAISSCSESSTDPGPMLLSVSLDEWVPGERSTFTARIDHWDHDASLAYRVVFCPDVVITEWTEEIGCEDLEVVDEDEVLASSVTGSYEWDGCGGTAFFSAAVLRDNVVYQREGAVAGC